ncbi:phosphatase PAP2 family protein [Streptomyces sp. SID5606]|nr:phosphatase PAP2 family protein [Streptomyces sp. SID5606]
MTVSGVRLPSVSMTFEDDALYRDITGIAQDSPAWVRHTAEVGTEAGLLLFGALFVVAWWRSRRGDPRAFAIAVLAPLATAVAYVCSELLKSVVEEERPCRAVAGAVSSLAQCPPTGDWSFPSNHATIAGGAAAALALVRWTAVRVTVPLALLMAFSRVFVGVHYPHDVVAGLLLGAVVAVAAVRLGIRPATRVAGAMRDSSAPVVRWVTGPGAVESGAGSPAHRRR